MGRYKETSHIDWAEHFYYDESSPTGLRRVKDWRTGRNMCIFRAPAGSVAGTMSPSGYYVVELSGVKYYCHRIIQELIGERLGQLSVDHEDGDKSNNKVSNLRRVTHLHNMRNQSSHSNNKSGVVGVKRREFVGKRGTLVQWVATWSTLDGRHGTKTFSVKKFGAENAFKLACEYRASMIAELNASGAGYTDRHGGSNETSI